MSETENRKPTFVTERAHSDLEKLAELMTETKGIKVRLIHANSIAISNELKRQQRLAERRQQRQQAQ